MKTALYTGTANLYKSMECSAKSLYAHTDVDDIWFFIEDEKFPTDLPPYVHTLDISQIAWDYLDPIGPNMNSKFTYMALIRAALALMPQFEDLDRVLSLDCDVAFVDDCPEVFDLPIEDCYMSASIEPANCIKGLRYCNTGVALYNLEKLRDGKAEEVLHLINVQHLPNDVQDAYSYLCQGHIHEMPGRYNATYFTEKSKKPAIIHFAGEKNWMHHKAISNWSIIPWETVEQNHSVLVKNLQTR